MCLAATLFTGGEPSHSRQANEQKPFDVTTCADAVPENDEDFTVVLSGQSSNAVLGTATASATIVDNDEPTVSISAPPRGCR